MIRSISTVYILFFINYISFVAGDFPNNPKPCPYGDSECIKKVVNLFLDEKIGGYAPLNIPDLNPLKISEIAIKQPKENPVYIDLRFRNSRMHGFKGAKATHVKGFGKDLEQTHEITISSKLMYLLSDYTIQGKVLVLPISGTGRSNITMANVKISLKLTGEPLVKNSETYMHVKKLKVGLDTTRVHFDFENLYNGDKALGDTTNSFLNENWKDIFGEVKNSILKAFTPVFKDVLNNVFENLPYDKLFVEAS
ncbi:protein takeout-like [Episyrphus balteatus]|uniref:protein takeout-like n=1 Tax=Episyrphus balteatus TaxID=286459 RepID=UPI0024867336|nr:protein takeout-like [Episyrphus balteatus]